MPLEELPAELPLKNYQSASMRGKKKESFLQQLEKQDLK